MRGWLVLLIGASLFATVGAGVAWWARSMKGVRLPPSPLEAAVVEEKLGVRLPLDLALRDMAGREVQLGDLLIPPGAPPRPTLLVLAYYGCRTLCSLVLEGSARALAGAEGRLGEDFRALTVSIDPHDTPADAAEKRAEVLTALGVAEQGEVWPFLVGGAAEIELLAATLGFGYQYDAATDQFAHPAVVFVLSPQGTISSYLYGIEPSVDELNRALEAANAGRTRATLERIMLRCFELIPALRQHAGLVKGLLRGSALVITLALAIFLGLLWRRELGREGVR